MIDEADDAAKFEEQSRTIGLMTFLNQIFLFLYLPFSSDGEKRKLFMI